MLALAAGGCTPDRVAEARNDAESRTQALTLAGNLEPGSFAVGFRKETLRWVSAREGRPTGLDLYLWFPATPAPHSDSTPPLVFADYYKVQESDEPDRETLRGWLREDMTAPPDLSTTDIDRVLDASMWARLDLEPAPGLHPLVLWSYRDSIPTMQSVLNEYLASHGYVVAFAWPLDHAPPLPWQEGADSSEKRSSLDTQIEILEHVLDAMKEREGVDTSRTSVLSWSYGGESAGGLQRVRAEVRLALGIDSTLASGWIFKSSDDLAALDRSELTAPYVLLRHGRARIDGDASTEPPLLTEVPAGAWYVTFPELSHGNFNAPGGMFPGLLNLPEVSPWAVGGEAAQVGYEQVCHQVLGFLNHYHKGYDVTPDGASTSAPADFVQLKQHPPHRSLE